MNQWFEERCNPDTSVRLARAQRHRCSVREPVRRPQPLPRLAYHLGFTELNYNMQQSNFGQGKDGDPEIGNVQAGAVDRRRPELPGRDNANQITLNDGIPGITNQYLFQPIAGAFYGPCVDGDFDTSVFGHEYTHAISNRMVGGPDDGLTGSRAARWASRGPTSSRSSTCTRTACRATGSRASTSPATAGGHPRLRLDANPLNYSDVGFDLTGPEVHADGEIWNATNFAIRQAMKRPVRRDLPVVRRRPAARLCATACVAVDQCPGNRRWIQLVFDAWTLMAVGSVSMVDASRR